MFFNNMLCCLKIHNINNMIINYLHQHIYYLNADNHNIIYCHNNPLIEYILLFKEHINVLHNIMNIILLMASYPMQTMLSLLLYINQILLALMFNNNKLRISLTINNKRSLLTFPFFKFDPWHLCC